MARPDPFLPAFNKYIVTPLVNRFGQSRGLEFAGIFALEGTVFWGFGDLIYLGNNICAG
jgi:hypothetical protein